MTKEVGGPIWTPEFLHLVEGTMHAKEQYTQDPKTGADEMLINKALGKKNNAQKTS